METNSDSNHNSRPAECSNAFLEKVEANPDFPDREEFMKELKKRRGSKRNLKALRASRREEYLAYVQEKTAKQNETSGDPRNLNSKKK